MKLILYYVGKARDPHANAMAAEYIQRSTRFAKCEMREIRPARFDLWAKHPSASKILLDPSGRALDSAAFTSLVERAGREGRDLVFVIGGAEGLRPARRPVAHDHAARAGARCARRADLSRVDNLARPPVSPLIHPLSLRDASPACGLRPRIVIGNAGQNHRRTVGKFGH